jgi:hypothetical protein
LRPAPLHAKLTQYAAEPERLSRSPRLYPLNIQNILRYTRIIMASTQYTYTPLPSPHHIRILHLQPQSNDPQDTIRATLQQVSLEARPFYNTLSYVWGPKDDPDQIILVEDHPFSIKQILFDALLELQPQPNAKPLFIWIDQICINQANIQERGFQVAIMGEVYRLCTKTIA